MALVKCKECGHEVSDKAGACPHCGMAVEVEPPKTICPECRCEITVGLPKCPRCGYPLEGSMEQKPGKPSGKLAGRKKLIIALAVVAAVAVLCAVLAFRGTGQGDILKLGMSYDEVITFLEEHGYEFEEIEPMDDWSSKGVYIQGEWDINGVKVNPSVSFSEKDDSLRNVGFGIDVYSPDDMHEKVRRIKKYVAKHYGKMVFNPAGGDNYDIYEFIKDDLRVSITCPPENRCDGDKMFFNFQILPTE